MIPNGKLGKLAPLYDPRTLLAAKYMPALPAPPASMNWGGMLRKVFPMYANDRLGDCAVAGPAHMVQVWTANARDETVIPEADVIAAYKSVSGYRSYLPWTDRGCVLLDVLKYWRKHGIGRHKIGAFAHVNPLDDTEWDTAMWLGGGLLIGLNLPVSAQKQDIWAVTEGPDAAPGSWGGHCVDVVAYDAHGDTVTTWGALKTMWADFRRRYCDEAWMIFADDWLMPNGCCPAGIDREQLIYDLGAIGDA